MSNAESQLQMSSPSTVIASELPIATWANTGDPEVDGALAELSALGSLTLAEQAAVFDEIQRKLRERLLNAVPEFLPDAVPEVLPEQGQANSSG